jgi:hypothetical protein
MVCLRQVAGERLLMPFKRISKPKKLWGKQQPGRRRTKHMRRDVLRDRQWSTATSPESDMAALIGGGLFRVAHESTFIYDGRAFGMPLTNASEITTDHVLLFSNHNLIEMTLEEYAQLA